MAPGWSSFSFLNGNFRKSHVPGEGPSSSSCQCFFLLGGREGLPQSLYQSRDLKERKRVVDCVTPKGVSNASTNYQR